MNYFSTSLMKNLLTNENKIPFFDEVIAELFRGELEKTINEILEYELRMFLDYECYDRNNKDDYRNKSYIHIFKTRYCVHDIKMPRYRLYLFHSSLHHKYPRHDYLTDQTIFDLFDKKLSNHDNIQLSLLKLRVRL